MRDYFASMSLIISQIKTLGQIVNIGETDFHESLDHDRRWTSVCNKNFETQATVCQETASTTLLLMITVAVDAQVSRSMFVCREKEPAPLNGAKVDQRLHTRVKELERPRHNSDMSW